MLPTLAALYISICQPAAADVTADFEVAGGRAVTLFAESPALYNPTAIDVDSRGRVWVAEAVNYRQWDGRNPGRHHDAGDRIVILEDRDGDGVAESSKIFAQERDLVSPLGIAVLGKRVFVSCSPSLFVYTDEDGDDVPERRDAFLTGFGGFDHDHGLHSVVAAPDGRLVFNAGNAGPHVVTDREGWTLRSGSLYRDGGPKSVDNRAGLRSDDGRLWTGGIVLRIDPDGRGLTVLAHNFRNNYEVALDSFGNLYQSDNDDDGSESCRTLWVMEGGNHGYFSSDGARYWMADHRPRQTTVRAHWHQDDPGVVPAGAIHGSGGPTGVAVYEGALLPELTGAVLDADAGRNCVWIHRPVRRGAGYEMDEGVLIAPRPSGREDDENARWFRPSDVAVGLDGSVFVADWWDPGVGGHAMGDKAAYGRILRVAPQGHAPAAAPVDASTIGGAVSALLSPAVNVRDLGFRALLARGAAAWPEVERLLSHADSRVRARAIFLATRMGDQGRHVAGIYLRDPDVDLRIAAFRALRGVDADVVPLARALVTDPSPAVRREVAIALRDVPLEKSRDLLFELARGYDGEDRFYLEAFGIAADGKEEALYPELRARYGGDAAGRSGTFRRLAWRLHPLAAVPELRARAMDRDLDPEARMEALDALAFVPAREAAEAMLDLALVGSGDDEKARAAFWVQHRSRNDWREFDLARHLAPQSLDGAELRWSSGVVKSGIADVDVDVSGATFLALAVTDAGDGNSCDWADWLEPRIEAEDGSVVALDGIDWLRASAEWGSARKGKNANGGPLSIGETVFERGIGTHAKSEIVFAMPIASGARRFRARVGPDDGGTKRGGPTSIEFQVHVVVPPDPSPLLARRATLLCASVPGTEVSIAARELAETRDGAFMLIRLDEEGRLPEAARETVRDALLRHADPAVRALAAPRFETGAAPRPVAAEIAKLPGDEKRGQSVFFSSDSQCSSCHLFRGRGGDVGPDLSEIRTKYGATELLEHLIEPNKAIAFGYDTWVIETEDGLVHTGFVLADGDDVLLKDTSGARVVVPAATIAARVKQKISTMPDTIALGIEPARLADLAAFLVAAPPSQEPKLGDEVALFNGKDLSGWTFHLADPKAKMEDVWSVSDGVLRCAGSPVGYIRTEKDYTNFVLTLEWRFPEGKPPGNSGVLLRMVGPDKVWPKSLEAQLMHRNAGDIWNIDDFPAKTDPARTSGRRTEKLLPTNEKPIGEWNRYVITLNRGELKLEVNGAVQNTASWCEEVPGKICLQSEGAEIEFRNIRLKPVE